MAVRKEDRRKVIHTGGYMALERTFSIIKPDVVARNLIGDIYHRFENAGLRIVAAKMVHLNREEASGFYCHLRSKPFFEELLEFMMSGPVMVQVLEGEDAIKRHREVIGDTDPKKARAGSIRADYATSIDQNAVHGSDCLEAAEKEIAYFFTDEELCPRTRYLSSA